MNIDRHQDAATASRGHASVRAARWDRRTRLLALGINAAWWADRFLPLVFVVGVGGSFLLVWARSRRPDLVPAAWGTIGVATLAAAVAAWFLARGRFESEASARVLLEDRLGLDARLSAAASGVGEWPESDPELARRWPVTLRLSRPLVGAVLVAAMLAAGALVPMAAAVVPSGRPERPPADVEAVSRWAEELDRAAAVDADTVRELADRAERILDRPRDRWYDHAGLEAAAHLREQTAADLDALARDLLEATSAAEALSRAGAGTPRDASVAKERLAEATRRLASGNVRPGAAAANDLSASSPDRLGELSREDLARLATALAANRAALREALARAGEFDLDAFDEAEPCPHCEAGGACPQCEAGKPCRGKRCTACEGRQGSARGGSIARGPGEAPLTLGRPAAVDGTRTERITALTDLERSAAGDLLEVIDGAPAAEEPWSGPRDGGVAVDGAGGGAVRVDELLPAERATLRRYFK